MKAKWYFSTIIILLTLFVVNQQQVGVPNQEIVLQFTNDEVTSLEAQNTIAIVKKQLQSIGIHDTKVVNENNGKLKITYYSDSDITIIKSVLSNGQKITLNDSTSFPSDKDSKDYNLDVYEIQKRTDSGSGVNGKFVLQSKQGYDRFANPDVITYAELVYTKNTDIAVKVALKINNSIAVAIDTITYKIPEVRAGPSC